VFRSEGYIPFLKEAKPESVLLSALKNDELKAIRYGADLPKSYWVNKIKVDHGIRFRRMNARRGGTTGTHFGMSFGRWHK
jgi:hypothetical protein